MTELLQQIISDPISSLLIIGNLVLIESLLSVDNAAVLATMVMDLPQDQRKRALKYGIKGADVFRGICLLLASYLVGMVSVGVTACGLLQQRMHPQLVFGRQLGGE